MSKPKPIRSDIAVLVVVLAVFGVVLWKVTTSSQLGLKYQVKGILKNYHHVYDRAGFLPEQDLLRFEWYMDMIMQESDVDIRFAFVKDTEGKTIEEYAVNLVQKMRIGGKTGKERGLLLLYDTQSKRLKVEVGYGLEEYFPDAFVGYLVNRHARQYFESGDKSLGLRLLLRLLQARIRSAVLGQTFDPRVLDMLPDDGNLSGGAGVSTTLPTEIVHGVQAFPQLNKIERNQFVAQESPEKAYRIYLKWLSQPVYDPNLDIFTERARKFLSGQSYSPAYRDFILLGEYGETYRIVERDNLAILYFTSTPFVSPHFFFKDANGWRMDILTEVQNTREIVGGIYNWTYIHNNDPHSKTFVDLLTNIQGYIRFKDGDNRALIIRGT